jgi:hypothetical protein
MRVEVEEKTSVIIEAARKTSQDVPRGRGEQPGPLDPKKDEGVGIIDSRFTGPDAPLYWRRPKNGDAEQWKDWNERRERIAVGRTRSLRMDVFEDGKSRNLWLLAQRWAGIDEEPYSLREMILESRETCHDFIRDEREPRDRPLISASIEDPKYPGSRLLVGCSGISLLTPEQHEKIWEVVPELRPEPGQEGHRIGYGYGWLVAEAARGLRSADQKLGIEDGVSIGPWLIRQGHMLARSMGIRAIVSEVSPGRKASLSMFTSEKLGLGYVTTDRPFSLFGRDTSQHGNTGIVWIGSDPRAPSPALAGA